MLSWVATALVFLSVFLAGRRTPLAWVAGFAASAIWVIVTLPFGDPGLTALNVGLAGLYAYNFVRDYRRFKRLNTPKALHHINGNRNDNRLENLEVVSPLERYAERDIAMTNMFRRFINQRREVAAKNRAVRELRNREREVAKLMGERLAQSEDMCAAMPMPASPPARRLAECKDCRSVVFADARENRVQKSHFELTDDFTFLRNDDEFYCGLCRPAYDVVHIIGDGAHFFVRREAAKQPGYVGGYDEMLPIHEYVECDEEGVVLGDEPDACCAIAPCPACAPDCDAERSGAEGQSQDD